MNGDPFIVRNFCVFLSREKQVIFTKSFEWDEFYGLYIKAQGPRRDNGCIKCSHRPTPDPHALLGTCIIQEHVLQLTL